MEDDVLPALDIGARIGTRIYLIKYLIAGPL